jgi:hypothetical protein
MEEGLSWLFGKRALSPVTLRSELLRYALGASAFLLSVISLVSSKFNPFIYFRF